MTKKTDKQIPKFDIEKIDKVSDEITDKLHDAKMSITEILMALELVKIDITYATSYEAAKAAINEENIRRATRTSVGSNIN